MSDKHRKCKYMDFSEFIEKMNARLQSPDIRETHRVQTGIFVRQWLQANNVNYYSGSWDEFDLVDKNKNFPVSMLLSYVNLIMDGNRLTEFKNAACSILEQILMDTGNYRGYHEELNDDGTVKTRFYYM